MMPRESHLDETLQDILDGRLSEAERSRAEAHLKVCARCRRELDALRWVKAEVQRNAGDEPVSRELAARVRAGLDAVEAESKRASARPARSRLGWAAAAGLIATVALIFIILIRRPTPVPDQVAGDFTALVAGRLPLGITASDPKTLETFFAQNGVGFPIRVFDLGMMGYALQGGRVHRLDDRAGALFVYRGEDGRMLMCQMFLASMAGLPPPDETRTLNGIQFQVYRRGITTLVFWQEGNEVCVLASDAPSETVIELAAAKAVKV